jgi:RHS repeat-associated protein
MGSQRIVSKLGDLDSYGQDPRRIAYAGSDVDGAGVDFAGKYIQSQQTIKDKYADFEVPYNGEDNDDYVNGGGFCCDDNPGLRAGAIGAGNDNPETFQYYYHSDHLGSSSLITNLDGEVVQHVEYVPFGEVFIEERNNKWNTPYLFNAKELDEETGLYYYGARYYDSRTSVWLSTDPLQEKYPNISTYAYTLQNPVKLIDPDGRAIRVANAESFNVLLSSLPAEARGMITIDSNNFIDANSVNAAYSQFGNSGNMQALCDMVTDERIIDFDATSTSYDYINAETGDIETYNFQSPIRTNDYQELLSKFEGTPQEKQAYAQYLLKTGFVDEIDVSGNFGATLRPSNAQQPYPGGQISTTNNFEIYVNPVGTTSTERAKNVGHELFGHLYFFFMGKDPRHGGASGMRDGSPLLDQQINNRERESEINAIH